MCRQDNRIPTLEVAVHPLNHVGEDIRCGMLDGCRQIDDAGLFCSRGPDLGNGIDDIARKLQFSAGEHFGGIFKNPFGIRLCLRQLLDNPRMLHGQLRNHLSLGQVEYNAPHDRSHGVVVMHDGAPRTAKGLKSAFNERFACLRKHLNGDVLRNPVFFNQETDKVEVGL